MGKKPKVSKREKSKPAKSEEGEQEKPKPVLFLLPSNPTDEEIKEFIKNLLGDNDGEDTGASNK